MLQPILVTEVAGGYQLIAGERACGPPSWPAWSASRPSCAPPTSSSSWLALVENLQRSDLNALDEARAFRSSMTSSG